jgi:ABC-type multidrug transport system fused ATPase/permease subunit
LREQIGLVTQETFLFHDTIFNNIQFGRLHATQEQIYEAAQLLTRMSSSWLSQRATTR